MDTARITTCLYRSVALGLMFVVVLLLATTTTRTGPSSTVQRVHEDCQTNSTCGSLWTINDDDDIEKVEEDHTTIDQQGSQPPQPILVDFLSQVQPVPRDKWPALDNLKCITQGAVEYPPPDTILRRTPYVIIIGCMKAGTTALGQYLYQHFQMVRPLGIKELHFYDVVYDNDIASIDGIPRKTARRKYAQVFRSALKENFVQLRQTNSSFLALDESPRYQFWSDRVPARVLCVTPWAKIVSILRNPVDRAFSHYTMLSTSPRNRHAVNITFEEWIDRDLRSLRELGVVRDWDEVNFEEFAGSDDERISWRAYTRTGTQGALGRGLYALQLRNWFQAYEEYGKSRSDIFIVRSERMREDTDGVYRELLDFLELPPVPLQDSSEKYKGRYGDSEMKAETRATLEEFFAPYNQQLYELLGDDWMGVWDPPPKS